MAKLRTYGAWAGSPKGEQEDVSRCVEGVFSGFTHYQCRRKRGHGKNGLYCKQHDPERIEAEVDAKMAKINLKAKMHEETRKRYKTLAGLSKGIPTEELSLYKLVFKKNFVES